MVDVTGLHVLPPPLVVVAVGDTEVAVGEPGVLVAEIGVAVGTTKVGVRVGAPLPALNAFRKDV